MTKSSPSLMIDQPVKIFSFLEAPFFIKHNLSPDDFELRIGVDVFFYSPQKFVVNNLTKKESQITTTTALLSRRSDWQVSSLQDELFVLSLDPYDVIRRNFLRDFPQYRSQHCVSDATVFEKAINFFSILKTSTPSYIDIKSQLCFALDIPNMRELENSSRYDPRITRVINHMIYSQDVNKAAKQAMNQIGLSQSRFRALFAEQVGINIKRLIKCAQLKQFLELIMSSGSISDAAISAGYNDLSHLNKSVRSMVGNNPSQFVAKGKCPKVYLL